MLARLPLLLLTLALMPAWSGAAEPSVAAQELLDQAAPKMPVSDVKKLLATGATIELVSGSGKTRRWTHTSDGTFTVSRQDERGRQHTGEGTWKIKDNGEYCIDIAWRGIDEQWCRSIYLYDNAMYVAPTDLKAEIGRRFGLFTVSR